MGRHKKVKKTEKFNGYVPKGYKVASDALCRKCLYHTDISVKDPVVACMYADRVGKCRSLEDGYIHGLCNHFKRGKATHADWLRTKQVVFSEE
jgi:hypothetical protein